MSSSCKLQCFLEGGTFCPFGGKTPLVNRVGEPACPFANEDYADDEEFDLVEDGSDF